MSAPLRPDGEDRGGGRQAGQLRASHRQPGPSPRSVGNTSLGGCRDAGSSGGQSWLRGNGSRDAAGTGLDASARQVVSAAAREIRQQQPSAVTVTGYTDALGSAAVNDRLSLARARAVARALRADLSGTSIRFRTEAQGQGAPVAANSTAAGRQLNRRVVIALG